MTFQAPLVFETLAAQFALKLHTPTRAKSRVLPSVRFSAKLAFRRFMRVHPLPVNLDSGLLNAREVAT